MAFCIDTDTIIEFFRGNETVTSKIQEKIDEEQTLYVTYITLCELFRGASLSQKVENETARIKLLLKSCIILDFSVEACEKFGEISAKLIREGSMVEEADLLIGCLALTHNCILVTNNVRHFSKIKGLQLENWMTR